MLPTTIAHCSTRSRTQLTAARESLNRYLKEFSGAIYAYEARARIAQAIGDQQAAIADLHTYLELAEQPNPGNYIAIAKLLTKQGNTTAALDILDQGLSRLGLIPALQREAIAIEEQRQDVQSAIVRLETLRAPLRENAQWKLEMAKLLLQTGDNKKAVEMLNGLRTDLQSKRPTPARKHILQEAAAIHARLDAKHQAR